MPLTTRRLVPAAVLLMALGAASACGSSSSGGTQSAGSAGSSPSAAAGAATVDPAVAAKVPASVKSAGTLTVAADASYAPNEFVGSDGTTVVGMDADLAKALGTVMGLPVQMKNVTFDAIIPGLKDNRYALGMSSFTDTLARQKVVDFVTYFSAGTSFFVKASGGPTINTLADLCGHKVAVESGTTQQTDATGQEKKCTAAGKPADTVLAFNTQNQANLALSSGRADASMADSPVAAYQVKQSSGTFKLTGQTYGTAPYGIAIPKGNGMAPVVLAALKDLMKDGVYQQILAHWGIQSGAITDPVINGATS